MLTGATIGHYRIEQKLGEGGMGAVYRALDTRMNRRVAVKVLSGDLGDAAARRRFQQEAQLASSLNHPHILTVFDAGEFDGRQYIVTEYVDGGTLKTWSFGVKPHWRRIVELLTGVADGLAAAHAAGILHRDIKPDNILVAKNGYAKVADFGLAKLADPAVSASDPTRAEGYTRPGAILGTVAYMSPEQATGKPLDARSDIFSFGVVLYELLAGRRPFAELAQTIAHPPPPLPDDLPSGLRAVVDKTLEKDPADRYASMRDVVVDLKRLTRQTAEIPPITTNAKSRWLWVVSTILAVAAGLGAWKFWPALTAPPRIRSIAVLPLQNLSGDPKQDYYSDGATDELISTLGQLHAFDKVISRTSVMRYKIATKSLPEIGRELDVDAIVEGSIQRVEGRLRVRARLIHAATDRQLWTKDYDRAGSDFLALQAELASAIAWEIRAEVNDEERSRLAAKPRIAVQAMDEYLLGRYHLAHLNESDLAAAITRFENALKLQPDFAAAEAGLSAAWVERGIWGKFPFREAEALARDRARRAIAIDPNLPEGHVALAQVLQNYDWDWAGAERELRQAVRLDPNSVEAHAWFGQLYQILGRFPEAIASSRRAVELDPQSAVRRSALGRILFRARRYDEATDQLQKAIEMDPRSGGAYSRLAELYAQIGRIQEAIEMQERSIRITGGDPAKSPRMARFYALAGRRQDALRALAGVAEGTINSSGLERALAYFALGDTQQGFKDLTRAFDERGLVIFTKHDPRFDSVRSDSRFQALVARLKIPDYSPASK